MSLKHTRLLILGFSISLCILLLAVLTLPRLLEQIITGRFNNATSVKVERVRINTISPGFVEAGLELSNNGQPLAILPRIRLQFSITKLLKKEMDVLLIDGGTIHWQVPESQQGTRNNTDKLLIGTQLETPILPALIKRIDFRNLNLTLHQNSARDSLQINGELLFEGEQLGKQGYRLNKTTATVTSHGALNGHFDLHLQPDSNTLLLTIKGNLTDTGRRSNLAILNRIPPWQGNLTVHGTAEFDPTRLRPVHVQGLITANDFSLKHRDISFSNTESQQPIKLSLTGTEQRIAYQLHNLQARHSMLALNMDIQGTASMTTESITITGNSNLISTTLEQSPIFLPNSLPLTASHQIIIKQGQPLQGSIQLKNTGSQPLILSRKNQQLQADSITINISTHHQDTNSGLQFDLRTQNLLFSQAPQTIEVPNIHIRTRLQSNPKQAILFTRIHIPLLHWPQAALTLQEINASLPLHWPSAVQTDTSGTPPGSLAIKDILHNDQQVALLSASLRQESSSLLYEGELISPLLPDCALNFTGHGDQKSISSNWHIPECSLDSATLTPLIPLPTDLGLLGRLSLNGTLELIPPLSASLTANLSQGQFSRSNQLLEDINLSIHLPKLPDLRSAPAQPLSVSRMTLGEIQFSQGEITWQLEDATTLFIERSLFNWCGGHLESGSFRLNLKNPLVDTTLYADRLTISTLLSQLGIPGTTGEGTLNGRLPVHFSSDGLRLDNGFLFSTPGDGGILNFSNQQLLRNSLPGNDQGASLDYVFDAVKHFAYDWTRLTFQSQGEDLRLTLSLNGKPARPLPYTYRRRQLVKDDQGPGLSHPVRLDVNFHLPLNQMLRQGQSINTLMETMRQ